MRFSATVSCGIGAGLVFALAACGSGDEEAKRTERSPAAVRKSPGSVGPSVVRDEGRALTGKEVTLTLPEGWKRVDPTQDASEVVQTSFGLTGENGALLKSLLTRQVRQGVLFAIDGRVTSGRAPHLQAGCDRGGSIGASLDQLKRKQKVLEPNSQITDVTVGGRPGFKATFTSEKQDGAFSGATVRVTVAADRFCFVDVEAGQGAMPPEAETILRSFRPV